MHSWHSSKLAQFYLRGSICWYEGFRVLFNALTPGAAVQSSIRCLISGQLIIGMELGVNYKMAMDGGRFQCLGSCCVYAEYL